MIYIQSDDERTLPHHFDAACAMYGARDSGRDFRLTLYSEVASGKFDQLLKTRLFVGSVEFMTEVFKRIGKTDVRVPENSNRPFKIMELGKIVSQQKLDGKKYFIKPFQIKLFTGLILDGFINTCLNELSPQTPVMVYDVFSSPISSEWRVYVHRNRIMDSHLYSGDFRVIPDYKYIEDIIDKNKKTFPIAYTIDAGVLESGETVVVEYNDMWAIGNYGIPNDMYLNALRDRYYEIVR